MLNSHPLEQLSSPNLSPRTRSWKPLQAQGKSKESLVAANGFALAYLEA